MASARERITTMAENGGPPQAAATLYPGTVMHQRLNPFRHRFAYRVFSVLLDVDRLDSIDRLSPLFSVNRANIASFHESDHVEKPGERVRAHADRLLSQAGLATPPARILLLCYPRLFGYVFNPISVYFAYDREDALVALIYSVRNTFGERHCYVAPLVDGELGPAGIRQGRRKRLHVSPFIGMGARYDFRILPPGRVVRLRIHERDAQAPLLSATFAGVARPFTSGALAALLLKFPLMTWKIMAGIHWEALKIWLKGARFHRSPPAPEPASYRDEETVCTPGE